MKIGRTYRFESAHWLPLVPDGHKCKNMHGHNYRVEIIIPGKPDFNGFIKDFAELDLIVSPFVKMLDHKILNDTITNPTAELIAAWFKENLCEQLNNLTVRVYENDDCYAEVGV